MVGRVNALRIKATAVLVMYLLRCSCLSGPNSFALLGWYMIVVIAVEQDIKNAKYCKLLRLLHNLCKWC